MTVLRVRTVPDPVLREVCSAVTVFDDDLAQFADDLLDTMYQAQGRGLAAPQVGETVRMYVMDATWKTGARSPQVFVNPEMMSQSETLAPLSEGCLSIPGDLIKVTRPDAVRLRWQDLEGGFAEADFTGFEAACTQHEIDHLDGILITDKPA